MDIQGKELDISIKFNTSSCFEIQGKCTASRNYRVEINNLYYNDAAHLRVKKDTLRQNGFASYNLDRRVSRKLYGPVAALAIPGILALRLNFVRVNKINGRRIEDYFGINLEKWPLNMLHLRFYTECNLTRALFKNKMGCSALQNTAKTPKEFVEQLMFGREIRAKLNIRSVPKIDGLAELSKICDVF